MGVKKKSEEAFQALVIQTLTAFGFEVYHTRNSIGSPAGYPDLTICKPPRLLFAELKTEKGKATAEQLRWARQLASCGNEFYWWRPTDWEEILYVAKGGVPE